MRKNENRNLSRTSLYLVTIAVAAYFFLIFSGALSQKIDFWSLLGGGLMVFLILAMWADPLFSRLIYGDFREKAWTALALGVGSALLSLWAVFGRKYFFKEVFPAECRAPDFYL